MRNDETGGDLDRAGSAEHVEQDQLALACGHSNIDPIEPAERTIGDRHWRARRKDAARWRRRMTARQAEDAVRIASLDERGNLGIRTPGGRGSDFHDTEHAEATFEGAPAVDDLDEKIAWEKGDGAPSRADPLSDLWGEDLEAGERDALGRKPIVISNGARDRPISH
jgi:hypothetical protein